MEKLRFGDDGVSFNLVEAGLCRLPKVPQQCPGTAEHRIFRFKSECFQRCRSNLIAEPLISFRNTEVPGGKLGDHGRMAVHQGLEVLMKEIVILIYQDFARIDLLQYTKQHGVPIVLIDQAQEKLSAGDVGITYGKTLFLKGEAEDKTVAVGLQKILFHHSGGCNHLHHFAFGKLACAVRQLSLFAYGDFLTSFQKTFDVDFCCMVGNSAHRLSVAFGKREIKKTRNLDGILFEHLVEITETEEKNALLVLLLDLTVLHHHRSQFLCFFFHA